MSPRVKKILRISFITANALAILCYLLACLVPFLNAGKFAFISLLGLVFPLLFFVLLGFLIYWLIRKKKRWTLICMASLLLSWKQVAVMFSFNTSKKFEVTKTPETLRVLSWNLSSWGQTGRTNKSKVSYKNDMIDMLKRTNADVICFQEFVFSKKLNFRDSVIPELKEQGYQYGYFVKSKYTMRLYKSAHVTGVVILSKYPITDTAQFNYSDEDFAEPLVYADIKINTKTIRFFTTHLESVRFGEYDYEALHQLKEPGKASVTQSRVVAWKLKQAYIKRSQQAEMLNEKVKASPYPAIVCGDFNDVPNSYTYFTIKGNLQDAFLKKGSGFGRTFRFISPTLRIDYILADKKFEVQQFNTLDVKYSDHYPVIADFEINEK
jgi:endonuclease/exonuclease/phosphatase family metal-dependent hydrolase